MNRNLHFWFLQDAGLDLDYIRAAPDGEAPAILEQIAKARAGGQPTQSRRTGRRLVPVSEGPANPTHVVSDELGAGAQQPGVQPVLVCADRHDSPRPETEVALADTRKTNNSPSPGLPPADPVEMAASPAIDMPVSTALAPALMKAPCPDITRKLKRDVVVDSDVLCDWGTGNDSAGVLATASSQEDDSYSPLPDLPGLGDDPLSVCHS